jgi:hypothetical protein
LGDARSSELEEVTMEAKNVDMYGHEILEWSRVLDQLESADTKGSYFLATTRPDGLPHMTGIGALWSDGKFYIVSGASTRKSQNLDQNNRCALGVSLRDVDLVVDGSAKKVTDAGTVRRLAKLYADQGWPAEERDGALVAPYSAPTAGPAPWDLYEFTPAQALAITTEEPHGATRWRFR